MTFAYMTYLSDYWWLLLTFIFGIVMFGGRRLDFILEWLTERRMKKLYPKLTKRYEDDIVDQDAYLSNLLGVNVHLDDLMERVYEINNKLIHNKMERVTYLELWILVKIYGKYLKKSENHIYYVNSKYFIGSLEISYKNLNSWALEFANSSEIREMKIGASFVLHKIRTKDPACDPKNDHDLNAVAGAVFDREYFFSSQDVSTGVIESEAETIELKNGGIIEANETGWHYVVNKNKLTLKERIDIDTSSQAKIQTPAEKEEEVVPQKEERETSSEEVIGYKGNKKIRLKETTEDGSQTLIDQKGRMHTVRSDIRALEKTVNKESKEEKDFEEEGVSKKPLLHKNQEASQATEMEENIDLMKMLLSDKVGAQRKKKKPAEEKTKVAETKNEKNQVATSNSKLTKKSMSIFIDDLPGDKNIFKEFLSNEKNEIYYCEEQKKFYISLTHLLKFIDESAVEGDEFASAIFMGPKFNQELFNEIVKGLGESIGENVKIENIKRRGFHRADEGYKEIYTFGAISGLDVLKEYPEKIARGLMSDRYNKAKYKAFVENFKDL